MISYTSIKVFRSGRSSQGCLSTPEKATEILILSRTPGSVESTKHPTQGLVLIKDNEMKESELSDDDKNRPLASFLIHGIIVTIGFAVLGGMVVYWVA